MYEATAFGLSLSSAAWAATLPGDAPLMWVSRSLLALTGLGFGLYALAAAVVAVLGVVVRRPGPARRRVSTRRRV